MQSIIELAEDYRQNAERLDKQIQRLKRKRKDVSGNDLYNLNQKIVAYEDMRDSMKATANKLTHYYDE